MRSKSPVLLVLLHLAATLAAGEPAATTTTLAATPAILSRSNNSITIQWSGLPSPSPLDYVAVYSPPSSGDLDYLGFLFLNGSASWATGAGSLTLPRLPDLRAPYQFRLFRWPQGEPSSNPRHDQDGDPLPDARRRVAVSGDVSFEESTATLPAQVHLAFADAPDEMRVVFVCGDARARAVRYGPAGRLEEEWDEAAATEARTYERRQMCGYPANDSVGWRHPGFVFDGVMKELQPGRRYHYKGELSACQFIRKLSLGSLQNYSGSEGVCRLGNFIPSSILSSTTPSHLLMMINRTKMLSAVSV